MADFFKFLHEVQHATAQIEAAVTAAGKQIGEAAQHAYEAAAPTMRDATEQMGTAARHAYATTAGKTNEAFDYLKDQAQACGGTAADVVSIDEIGRKMASLGTPAIAFAVAASVAGGMGLAGGAVVTTALAMLGGPFGMIGGLVALGVLTVIADAVGKYGIEAVLAATFQARQEQGLTNEQICQDIDALWISDALKMKIKQHIKHTPA